MNRERERWRIKLATEETKERDTDTEEIRWRSVCDDVDKHFKSDDITSFRNTASGPFFHST